MRQPRPIVRLVAAVLAVTQVTGCGSAWRRPAGVAPADAVTTWHPDSIRVVTSDRRITLHHPAVQGDSLVGQIPVTRRADTIAVLRSDVVSLKAKGAGAVLTLRDSSVLEITELWERGDSLGGPSVPRQVWEPLVIPLTAVRWIELSALPGTGAWRRTAQLPLARGQTVRVRIASADSTHADPAFLRGEVSRMTGDSLVMTVNGEERRIALASVSRLEVLAGRGNHVVRGALIGIAVPLAAATMILATTDDCSGCSGLVAPQVVTAIGVGTVGVLAGGLLGVILGASSRSDRWQAVPLERAGRSPMP
jgi:hypothetical protein